MRTLIIGIIAALVLAACQTVPLQDIKLNQSTYGDEAESWGVAPTTELRLKPYHGPTPLTHPGATVIVTKDLHARLIGQNPPLLIDVMSGDGHQTIPGAIWLNGIGRGGSFHDAVQEKLATRHAGITGGDPSRAVVFFCLSSECWLSYNAALRFQKLGYRNIFWYRGGIEAWQQAGLPTQYSTQ